LVLLPAMQGVLSTRWRVSLSRLSVLSDSSEPLFHLDGGVSADALGFSDKRLERRWLQVGQATSIVSGARTLILWTLCVLVGRTAIYWNRPACLYFKISSTVVYTARALEYGFLTFSIVPLLLCLKSPRPIYYFPVVALHFVYLIAVAMPPYAYTCEELFNLVECDARTHRVKVAARHLDCSLQGNTNLQGFMTWLLITPRILPRMRHMHLTWIWIGVAYVGATFWYREWADEKYFGFFDIFACVAILSFTQGIAISKKFFLEKSQRNKFMYDVKQREVSQKMFHILEYMVPIHVIPQMLKKPGEVIAEPVSRASILFIMICDFDQYVRRKSPEELLEFLNRHFKRMDEVCAMHEVTKIETVAEEYVAAVGVVPEDVQEDKANGHGKIVGRLTRVANDILKYHEKNDGRGLDERVTFKMGMHTGPVVAGVIGQKLPRFRLFGDTINTAARMMQKGLPDKLQFGEATREVLPDWVNCTPRGEIEMKGKGKVMAYFLEGESEQPVAPKSRKRVSFADDGTYLWDRDRSSASFGAGGSSKRPTLVHKLMSLQEPDTSFDVPPSSSSVNQRGEEVSKPPSTRRASSRASSVAVGAAAAAAGRASAATLQEVELTSLSVRGMSAPLLDQGQGTLRIKTVAFQDEDEDMSMLRVDSTTPRHHNEEKEGEDDHFERVLHQVSVDDADDRSKSHGRWLLPLGLDAEGFTPEMEKRWYQWFHKSVICKKLIARLDKQALALSLVTMLDTIIMVMTRAAEKPHNLYGPSLRFPVFLGCRASAFLIIMVWRVVACPPEWVEGSPREVNGWVESSPREVNNRLLISYCIIACLMFVSYDMMTITNDAVGLHWTFEEIKRKILSEHARESSFASLVFVPAFFVVTTVHQILFLPSCVYIVLAAGLMCLSFLSFRDSDGQDVKLGNMFFSTPGKFFFIFNSVMNAYLAHANEQTSRARFKAQHAMELTQERIETILNTLMPPLVVADLRTRDANAPPPSHKYTRATIAQSDLCGFTALASTRKPEEVVTFIGELFGIFDGLTDKYEIYKVETVGDAYIAGQADEPLTLTNKPISVVLFGLDMVRSTHEWSRNMGESVSCRVGVHMGECIGGIVGTEMQRYHLFGALMSGVEVLESTAPEGRVQVSKACKDGVERQMREENLPREVLMFEARTEPHLQTSKGDIIEYEEVGGGPTYVVRSYTQLRSMMGFK